MCFKSFWNPFVGEIWKCFKKLATKSLESYKQSFMDDSGGNCASEV
jgi:hypothetical protein